MIANSISSFLKPILAIAVGIILWKFSSKLPHVLLAVAAFAWALKTCPSGSPVWRNLAGFAFIATLILTILSITWSSAPTLSARSLLKIIHWIPAAFALPILFHSPEKAWRAIVYAAISATLILVADLARLTLTLGPHLAQTARFTEPYVLNHPNVASILAAAGAIVFIACAWQYRNRPALCSAALLAALLNILYLLILRSRGPQLAFAITGLTATLLIRSPRARAIGFAIAATIAITLAFTIPHINPRFTEKSFSTFSERDTVWKQTWQLANQHPLLGYGFGKKIFEETYYRSNPPRSTFHFPHPHSYWLMLLFEGGWPRVALFLFAWISLATRIARALATTAPGPNRTPIAAAALLLILLHTYGLADFPDGILQMMTLLLVPITLVLTSPKPVASVGTQQHAN